MCFKGIICMTIWKEIEEVNESFLLFDSKIYQQYYWGQMKWIAIAVATESTDYNYS